MRPSAHTVVSQSGCILLLRRGLTAPWAPGLWGLPGGYIEAGETPTQAAVRELGEEAGIDPPFRIRYCGLIVQSFHLFTVTRPDAYPFQALCRDGEHDAVAWVHPAEVHDYALAPGVSLLLAAAALAAGRVGA